jgi:hypothetical protein
VRNAAGKPIRRAGAVPPGERLALEFADGTVRAAAEGGARAPKRKLSELFKQRTLFDT